MSEHTEMTGPGAKTIALRSDASAPANGPSAAQTAGTQPRAQRAVRGSGKLLVVDDESWVRTLLTDYFADEGYCVRQASNAEDALAAVRQNHPDVVLLDLGLPGTGGLEVLKRLRRHDGRIAVIAIGCAQDLALAQAALQVGAVDYLFKPFNLDQLDHAVRSSMNTLRLFDEPDPASFAFCQVQGVTIIAPKRNLDAGAAGQMKIVLAELVERGASKLLIDLVAVGYVDSAGLGALVSVMKQVRAVGGDLKLCAVNEEVCGLLRMTGLANHLAVYSNRQDAVAAFL
jgi:anti-anti-sigma factor